MWHYKHKNISLDVPHNAIKRNASPNAHPLDLFLSKIRVSSLENVNHPTADHPRARSPVAASLPVILFQRSLEPSPLAGRRPELREGERELK